jgi:hypothetical protein
MTLNFFMEFFIISARTIWKQRNDFIFSRNIPSFQSWKGCFLQEAVLQSNRLNRTSALFSLALLICIDSFYLFLLFSLWVGPLRPCTGICCYLFINKICGAGVSLAVFGQKKTIEHLVTKMILASHVSCY